MNKSIMKTRSQLERITYKINQLKTKYTAENYVQFDVSPVTNISKHGAQQYQPNNYAYFQSYSQADKNKRENRQDRPLTTILGGNIKNKKDNAKNKLKIEYNLEPTHQKFSQQHHASQPQLQLADCRTAQQIKNRIAQNQHKNQQLVQNKIMGARKSVPVPVTVVQLDSISHLDHDNHNRDNHNRDNHNRDNHNRDNRKDIHPNNGYSNNQLNTKKQLKIIKNELCSYLDVAVHNKIKQLSQQYQTKIYEKLSSQLCQKIKIQFQSCSPSGSHAIDSIEHNESLVNQSEHESATNRFYADKQIMEQTENRLTKLEQQLTNCLSTIQQIYTKIQQQEQQLQQTKLSAKQKCQQNVLALRQYQNRITQSVLEKVTRYQQQLDEKMNKVQSSLSNSMRLHKQQVISQINNLSDKFDKKCKVLNLKIQQQQKQFEKNVEPQLQSDQLLNTKIQDIVQSCIQQHDDYITEQIQQVLKSMEPIQLIIQQQEQLTEVYEEIKCKINDIEATGAQHRAQIEKNMEQQQDYKCIYTSLKEKIEPLSAIIDKLAAQMQNMQQKFDNQVELSNSSITQLQQKWQTKIINAQQQLLARIQWNKKQTDQCFNPKISAITDKLCSYQTKMCSQLQRIQSAYKSNKNTTAQVKIAELKNIGSTDAINREQVQEKLNQFENDINQTLKLLYQDIQGRVNEMLGKFGGIPPHLQQKILSIQQKLCRLAQNDTRQVLRRTQNEQELSHADEAGDERGRESEQIKQLRQELSNTIGFQIDRLGEIVQRTVEQMQLKMQKLDNNFGYIYDKMSKIQYDNALFKDQLSNISQQQRQKKPTQARRYSEDFSKDIIKNNNSDSNANLLNILGQLTTNNFSDQGSLEYIINQ